MDMKGLDADDLRIFFLPFLTTSHMMPVVDMARAFAAINGVDVTIITTPYNAPLFQNSIDRDREESGHRIRIHLITFPSAQVGLPEGIENFTAATSRDISIKLMQAVRMLQPEIEQLFRDHRPDCIVSDMMYPWTADFATQAGIPRLLGHVMGYFSLCCDKNLELSQAHLHVQSETEKFELPGLPDKIEMTRSRLPDWIKSPSGPAGLTIKAVEESKRKTLGILVNTYAELEQPYEEYYRQTMMGIGIGMKTWSIGPVYLRLNKHEAVHQEEASRCGEWKAWLDSKQTNSVLYVNFGSLIKFAAAQLIEIAAGLEASGHHFIWVVRRKDDEDNNEKAEWSVEEVEKRFKESNQGFIIRNWAPQLQILDHPAIGGMVTQCGWNSVVEGVNAGLPMITWPLVFEQFYTEKLLTDIHRIGVPVGAEFCRNSGEEDTGEVVVKREKIERAVRFLMGGGEEAAEMRKRVEKLGVAGKKAVEKGGSSHHNLQVLIDELKSLRRARHEHNA